VASLGWAADVPVMFSPDPVIGGRSNQTIRWAGHSATGFLRPQSRRSNDVSPALSGGIRPVCRPLHVIARLLDRPHSAADECRGISRPPEHNPIRPVHLDWNGHIAL